MASKTNSRNWNDAQMAIVAIALVLTLTLWNLFAGPDRVKADSNQNAPSAQTMETSPVAILPNPTKILLGGAAPNQYVVVPKKQRRNGGGGGGTTGGGGGGTTGGGGGDIGGGGGGGGGTGGS